MIKELIKLSKRVGNNPAFVQGGGGNTSLKINNQEMYIKASGFSLKKMSNDLGLVKVNYKKIKKLYNHLMIGNLEQAEIKAVQYISDNTYKSNHRASIETGLHSFLGKVVLHTHSVYANILSCSIEGHQLVTKIFGNNKYLWINYANPGANLAYVCRKQIDNYNKKWGYFPNVIFLQNHGLVVTGENIDDVNNTHNYINNNIKKYFGLVNKYPNIKLKKIGKDEWESLTPYLKSNKIKKIISSIKKSIIFPDQVVYLQENITTISKITKGRVYHCSYNKALAIEESLVAMVYITQAIQDNKLHIKKISDKNIKYILNMESEKYRIKNI